MFINYVLDFISGLNNLLINKMKLELSAGQSERLRRRLIEDDFHIILEGIYVRDETATERDRLLGDSEEDLKIKREEEEKRKKKVYVRPRLGFNVFSPVGRFEENQIVFYNPGNECLNDNQKRLISVYEETK